MTFLHRAAGAPRSLGILPGAFNPPTRAHEALAEAALAIVDEVVFALPYRFPHKGWEAASMEWREQMLATLAQTRPRWSAARTDGSLYVEIVRDSRAAYGPGVELHALCGRDAAQRIVEWDYGDPHAVRVMLQEFRILAAPRQGHYEPPEHLREAVMRLPVEAGYDEVSSSEVRRRIVAGEPWEELVPEPIRGLVREAYR